jgi:ribonuclease D
MHVITTTSELTEFCNAASGKGFVCVDTEFMRESTFYSQLCLIQAATDDSEVIIDPLADDIDLAPFNALLMNTEITKVMHAARQDMEIFYMMCKAVPAPVFDTQIAAMALGFGDSCGYMALVKGRLDVNLDKGARFTDWSRRPLSEKQLHYAIGDVTHLRDLYPGMIEELTDRGRLKWVLEEMAPQMDESLYTFEPEEAWSRLKVRNYKKPYLAALKAAAAWREREAIARDIPRRRVMKDDSLYDLALNKPTDIKALAKLRSIPRGFEKSSKATDLVESIATAVANADGYAPDVAKPKNRPPNTGAAIEMLKTLLRLRTEYVDIAPRLVANNADIERIAAFGEAADVAALKGWRREVFGDDALKMLAGKIALRLEDNEVVAEDI